MPTPPPTSGPLITRALTARNTDTLRGGHVWGSGLSRKGKGSAKGEAEAPRARGCSVEPHPPYPRPPLRRAATSRAQAKPWDRAAQPSSRLLPGDGRAATCPPPSGHRLASRWAPSPAAVPARHGPLGLAPLARPRLQTVGHVGG